MAKYHDLVRLARSAAESAARYIRHVARPAEWTRKGQHDFVTSVDREAERLIAETLTKGEPESVVMGEELSPDAVHDGLVWIVDPLDGTTNYLHGYPQYGVSICAVASGELVAGLVTDVDRNITYHAEAGGGAWCGDRRLAVSAIADPAVSLIGTGFPFRTPEQIPRYLRQFTSVMGTTSGIRRAGAASLDLADVALGRLDGFWELHLAPWDVAAGTLLIREAGGVVTDLTGSPNVVRHGPIVAGNPALHSWLRTTLERS